MSRFSFFQIEKLTSLMTQDTVTGQELPALSDEVVGVIKAHLSLGEETDKFDGILIEIVDPSNPLLASTNTSHVLCSYPGTMFSPSVYAVSVATQSKTLNVPTFSNYAAVYETTSSRLAKEMLTMHRPKIIVSLGKDTHSAKLAKEFGLDHVNATTLQSGSTDNETTLSLISKAVAASANTRGILIDGFPNSGAEAKALEEAVGPVSAVLNFNASFITNNSVAAIKRRLLGITDELQPVERPVVKHFGARVIPIQGNGDEESAYQEAWSKLFSAGIFNRDQNIVVSIGSGSFPAEANMLSSQLAKDYNLSLVRLGEAKLQSEALVAKCLEFFQAQQEQSKHITRLEQQLYDLMSLQQEKEEEAGIIHIFQKQQETKEVDLLRSQVESLTKETAEQAERIRLLSIESNFAKRALIDTRETHAAELQVLLDENTAHQNDFNTLINEHSDLTAQHSELQASHSDLKEFSTDMVQRHESAQKEIENRKFYYEGVIEKLKTDLETTTTERDAALQKMVEAQTQTAYYYQTWVEMDANVQSLNQQLIKAHDKYKKSRAKELEDDVERLEQVILQLNAEIAFLKTLIKSSAGANMETRSMSNSVGRRTWTLK